MSKSFDITGEKFGRLTAIKKEDDYVSPKGAHVERWLCKCQCGKTVIINKHSLLSGLSKSCGCYRIDCRTKQLSFYIDNNCVYVDSSRNKQFIVDIDDWDYVSKFRWHISKNGYVVRNSDKKTLHRLLMNPQPHELIDHINKNKLDNRRSNLRVVDYSINGYNKTLKAGKTGEPFITIYKGIYKVQIDKKYVGSSHNLEDAIKIRDNALQNSKVGKYNYELFENLNIKNYQD